MYSFVQELNSGPPILSNLEYVGDAHHLPFGFISLTIYFPFTDLKFSTRFLAISTIWSWEILYILTEESDDAILLGFRNQGKTSLDAMPFVFSRKSLSVLSRAHKETASASTERTLPSDERRVKNAVTCWQQKNKNWTFQCHVVTAWKADINTVKPTGKARKGTKNHIKRKECLETSFGLASSSIFLSLPGLNNKSSKLQRWCRTTCRKVMASIFLDVVLERISALSVLCNFFAFSLTFLAGKNYQNNVFSPFRKHSIFILLSFLFLQQMNGVL